MKSLILRLSAGALCLSSFVTSRGDAAPTYFLGGESAVGPNANPDTRVNLNIQATAFATAAAPTTLVNFESGVTGGRTGNTVALNLGNGLTYTQQFSDTSAGVFHSSQNDIITGFNTTVGESRLLRFSANSSANAGTATFRFANAIDAFGAYFTGVGTSGTTAFITFNDGTMRSQTLIDQGPAGGVQFFGFVDLGARIKSVVLNSNPNDLIGIDDIRFSLATPEPSTMVSVAFASLCGFLLIHRKRRQAIKRNVLL